MERVPGITSCRHCIVNTVTSFLLHVGDEHFFSIFYHFSGASKVWYVVRDAFQTRLETAVSSHAVDSEYLSDYCEDARQVVATKNTIFNLMTVLQR